MSALANGNAMTRLAVALALCLLLVPAATALPVISQVQVLPEEVKRMGQDLIGDQTIGNENILPGASVCLIWTPAGPTLQSGSSCHIGSVSVGHCVDLVVCIVVGIELPPPSSIVNPPKPDELGLPP